MKLLMSRGWLRERLKNTPDLDIAAGLIEAQMVNEIGTVERVASTGRISSDEHKIRLRIALGTLVRQLREKNRLSVAELAARARVSEQDIREIEHDPRILPRPRTISQLANVFKLPAQKLQQLSGLTQAVDRSVSDAAAKYAARSDDLSKLNDDERQALDAFVSVLSDTQGK